MKDSKVKDRRTYIDLLRIIATFSVVVLHVSAQMWYSIDVNSFDWNAINIFDGAFRWGVPIFVMISGILFLSRNISLKDILKKNELRLVTAFIFWSFIYALPFIGDMKSFFMVLISGHFHMWYILFAIGLYLLIPVFKVIVDNEKALKYYLLLFFIFTIILPTVDALVSDFGSGTICAGIKGILDNIKTVRLDFLLGYPGYFMLGYYLDRKEIIKKHRIIIYLLGVAGLVSTIVLTSVVSRKWGIAVDIYYDSFMLNVFAVVVAIFVLVKQLRITNQRAIRILAVNSEFCFGIYLIHPLIIEKLSTLMHFGTYSFNYILSIPVISLLVFLCSYSVSFILNKIPFIRKYIV